MIRSVCTGVGLERHSMHVLSEVVLDHLRLSGPNCPKRVDSVRGLN